MVPLGVGPLDGVLYLAVDKGSLDFLSSGLGGMGLGDLWVTTI